MPKRSRSRSRSYDYKPPPIHQPEQNDKEPKLYISGLPLNVEEGELKRIFDKYGDVTFVCIKRQQNFVFAFLNFNHIREAYQAIEGAKIGQYIKGKRLKVDFAKPKKFKDEPKSNNKRECYNCGGEGHLSKFCLKNNGLPSNSHQSNNLQKQKNNNNDYSRNDHNDKASSNKESQSKRRSPVKSRSRQMSHTSSRHKSSRKRNTSSSRSRSSDKSNRRTHDKKKKNRDYHKKSSSISSSRSSGAREKRSRSRNGARKSRLLRKRSSSQRRPRC